MKKNLLSILLTFFLISSIQIIQPDVTLTKEIEIDIPSPVVNMMADPGHGDTG
ncbi:hypothetical protein [Paraliobacillus sediminis]|uniref:hypothetical protein n=1 Tax=Paraliobacillus sediminis TaxID=1885916 RepID=UPI0013C2A37F|nr:hypothetical protein [Paraliobacillus sediminis]